MSYLPLTLADLLPSHLAPTDLSLARLQQRKPIEKAKRPFWFTCTFPARCDPASQNPTGQSSIFLELSFPGLQLPLPTSSPTANGDATTWYLTPTMRLLNAKTLQLETFLDENDIPKYAILSHTWGRDELVLQDLLSGPDAHERAKLKEGYNKVKLCCDQALKDRIAWAWVDTCCIDKTSSAELSEAINSMFRWYQKAEVCYAFLSDVPGHSGHTGTTSDSESIASSKSTIPTTINSRSKAVFGQEEDHSTSSSTDAGYRDLGLEDMDSSDPDSTGPDPATLDSTNSASLSVSTLPNGFSHSRWFTRGWTLQELLAPESVFFYSADWKFLGTKFSLVNSISDITGIETPWLLKDIPLGIASIAQRMAWASKRKTTRIEDEAYSLMGIFGVNMPLI